MLRRIYEKLKQVPFGGKLAEVRGCSLQSAAAANLIVSEAISTARPYCVSRVGGIEAKAILWAEQVLVPGKLGLYYPTFYWETSLCVTNAGLRPRSKASYKEYAALACNALREVDAMGVWNTCYEKAIIETIIDQELVITAGAHYSPTFDIHPHWIERVAASKCLAISPFKKTITMQLSRIEKVWAGREISWSWEVEPIQFPYLIDDSCSLDWRDVYKSFKDIIWGSDADVVLCGCGGLGLLLAVEAKKAGKVGLHLGGFLQLLFGIYGQRHLEQPWHKKFFNDSWTRPLPEERAESSPRVEGGCYW